MTKKIDVRERLLTAALETLHESGFNATGVQDITDAAGVPKGSFYNHFASKDALGVEVVGRYLTRGEERRKALVHGQGAPLVRLKAYFKSLNQLGPASGFSRGCLLGNFSAELASQSADIRVALDGALTRWTNDIALVIAEAQTAGEVAGIFRPPRSRAFCSMPGKARSSGPGSKRARRHSTLSSPSLSEKFSPDTGKLARRSSAAHPARDDRSS